LLFAGSESGWVFVLSEDSALRVIDPDDGTIEASIVLTGGKPEALFPTPGGKFVYVTYRDANTISMVDAETMEEVHSFRISKGHPEQIAFTPMGEFIYITYTDSDLITVFRRDGFEHVVEEEYSLGDPGAPVIFNRRATRFYRLAEGALGFVYIKTKEVIKEIGLPEEAKSWVFSPDFRFLWGIGPREVYVVDEKRGRLVKRISLASVSEKALFSSDGRRIYLLDETGGEVNILDERYRVVGNLALPEPAASLDYGEDGALWAVGSTTGTVYALDLSSEGVSRRIALPGSPKQLRFVKLRRGEGFACFG
jgi:DNA-binding beta-propeller fold protein YncE